jgi:hypothetical protein
MGDLLWRLEAKPKMFWSCAIPASHRLAVWDSVKSIVDLGGEEAFRVKLQHLRRRKLLRIKSPSPRGILESGGADQRNHDEKIQKARYRIQNTLSSIRQGRPPHEFQKLNKWGPARRSQRRNRSRTLASAGRPGRSRRTSRFRRSVSSTPPSSVKSVQFYPEEFRGCGLFPSPLEISRNVSL